MDYKRKRKKYSYMDAFLKIRQQAVDFAIKRSKQSGYDYSKPLYYINDINDINDNEVSLNKKAEKVNKHNKRENTYNNLKNDLIRETKSINNFIINKKNKKSKNPNDIVKKLEQLKSDDEELVDFLITNEEKNKKYQDIQKYSINIPFEKNVANKEKVNSKKKQTHINNMNNEKRINSGFWNNLKIERINEANYCISNNQDKNKINKIITSSNMTRNREHLAQNNNIIDYFKSTKNKNNKIIRRNHTNDIYCINNYNDRLNYYEGENHRFYDSSGVKDYNYSYESYKVKKYYKIKDGQNKSKNISEQKHMKQKKLFDDNIGNKKNEIPHIKNKMKTDDILDNNDNYKILNRNYINNDNKLIKGCSYNNKKLNLFNSGKKDTKKSEKINNLKFVKVINFSPNCKAGNITQKSSTEDNVNLVKSGKNKGNEILGIINDGKNIANNNFFKQKSERKNKNRKINSIKNIIDNNDNNNNMLYCKSFNNIKDICILNEKEHYMTKNRKESFCGQKEDEKEPNIQSIICDFSLNDDPIIKQKNIGNIVYDIKSKIKIIKNSIIKDKENINYINEIDTYYRNIKEKEKKNLLLKDYQNNKSKARKNINEHNILFQQKSQRLNHMINDIFDCQNKTGINIYQRNPCLNYYYNNTNPNSSTNITMENHKNKKEYQIFRNRNIKEYKLLSNTDINSIKEQNENEKIKIIDEKDFQQLKNRNIKSCRNYSDINRRIKDINEKKIGYMNNVNSNKRKDQFFFNGRSNRYNGNSNFLLSPKSILFYREHKIMPPNEILLKK